MNTILRGLTAALSLVFAMPAMAEITVTDLDGRTVRCGNSRPS